MARRDPRAVLGVDAGATAQEIHEAYVRTARRIHPDNFDKQRQPDLWTAANAALTELNEAYGLLSGAPRQTSPRGPSRPDFDTTGIVEDCLRAWRPDWGMPESDYEPFLYRHLNVAKLVADVALLMQSKVGLTKQDVLRECQAILSQRDGELRKAMASWYCNRASESRDTAVQRFNAIASSLPRAVISAINHLVQSLEDATKYLELAARLDPYSERLREIRTRLAKDLDEARAARKRAESVSTESRPATAPAGATSTPSRPVRRPRSRRWVWTALVAVAVLLSLWAVLSRKRSKEDTLRREFTAMLEAGHKGDQNRQDQLLSRLLARTDTGYIAAAINVGSDAEPGLKQVALLYLARASAKSTAAQRSSVVGFALQTLVIGEEYAKGYARHCLDQFDPVWLQTSLQNMLVGSSLVSALSRVAAQELVLRGGADAVAFLLNRNAYIGPATDIATLLEDADPYDIVAGSRKSDASGLPPQLRTCIVQAERELQASRGVSFALARVDGLDAGTAQIEIHNEARVNLYLDLTPCSAGKGYSFMFPAYTTRSVAISAKSYYYRADARRSEINGTRGAHEFAGRYSHVWVFFLDNQRAQMKAKYPDMQFRQADATSGK